MPLPLAGEGRITDLRSKFFSAAAGLSSLLLMEKVKMVVAQ
jgi:hypothetical protein